MKIQISRVSNNNWRLNFNGSMWMKFRPMINVMLPFENQEVNASSKDCAGEQCEQCEQCERCEQRLDVNEISARGKEGKRKSALVRFSVILYLHWKRGSSVPPFVPRSAALRPLYLPIKLLVAAPPPGGCTPLYKPCMYVPLPHRVGFLRRFSLKTGIDFAHFGLESGTVIERTTGL